jgi:hypothetical protein
VRVQQAWVSSLLMGLTLTLQSRAKFQDREGLTNVLSWWR